MEEIISAISTASGTGGVAIIRASGENVLSLAEKMFKPLSKTVKVKDFEPYKMYVGEIDAGDFTDFGMMVFFKGPKSYTGEDMIEFHCHGGVIITQGILKRTYELGAIPATRGEFTKRAFVNGKLSLDSAEGLINMINSESTASLKVGYNLYREKLYAKINELQDDLTYALASVDADIDYPEEDLESVAKSDVKKAMEKSLAEVDFLLGSYVKGEKVKNGVKVAIVGRPNTGKSSILNALLNYDKAIVSSVAGTTRDVVEGSLSISGVKFDFYDTAGIRETDNDIEKLGIERSEKLLKSSDIALVVIDGSEELTDEDKSIIEAVSDKENIIVYNKSDKDIKIKSEKAMPLSAKTGDGVEELKAELYKRVFGGGVDLNSQYVAEERHYYALKKAKESLLEGLLNIDIVPLDLVAEDIKSVWLALGEITGKTASEEIIDEIFKKFCVGK